MHRLAVELSEEERQRIRRRLTGVPAVTLAAGRTLRAGAFPQAVLFVVDRGVAVVAARDGRRTVVTFAKPGDVLLRPGPRQEVRSLARVELTPLSEEVLRSLLGEPDASRAIVSALIEAISDREESLVNVARFPHLVRVRGKLEQLARSLGRVRRDGVLIDLPLTHELIAEAVGSTRETVTLALNELEQTGLISRAGRRYRINLSAEQLTADGR